MMKDLQEAINAYKEAIQQGHLQKAYAGLVKYMMRLGTNLSKNLSDRYVVGSIFQGYMDYTYFYFTNDDLKKWKLKFGLVLNHASMRFELWLLGQTVSVQERYWEHFKSTVWNKGRTTKPQYAILETVLIDSPDFRDLDLLTALLEEKLLHVSAKIIDDIRTSGLD